MCGRPESESPEEPEENRREARGCDRPEGRCPWPRIDPEAWTLFGVWSDWKSCGLLPDSGAIGDQPAWVVEAITGLNAEMDTINAEAMRPKKTSAGQANAIGPTNKAPPTVTTTKLPPKDKRRPKPKQP
jgi:hypothetical protein